MYLISIISKSIKFPKYCRDNGIQGKVFIQFVVNALLKDFSDLSPGEIKMCAFLKLKMSSKEIALINHMTISSVEVARSRLGKKFGIINMSTSSTLNRLDNSHRI